MKKVIGKKTIYFSSRSLDVLENVPVVYLITFPNDKQYIGSTSSLIDRIKEHCYHTNVGALDGKILYETFKFFGTARIDVIGSYDNRDIAYDVEKNLIRIVADNIYEKLGGVGDYNKIVGTTLLNSYHYK